MAKYRTVLFLANGERVYRGWPGVLRGGLTEEQAKAVCNDPETSAYTCTNQAILNRYGNSGWFVGYGEQASR